MPLPRRFLELLSRHLLPLPWVCRRAILVHLPFPRHCPAEVLRCEQAYYDALQLEKGDHAPLWLVENDAGVARLKLATMSVAYVWATPTRILEYKLGEGRR